MEKVSDEHADTSDTSEKPCRGSPFVKNFQLMTTKLRIPLALVFFDSESVSR